MKKQLTLLSLLTVFLIAVACSDQPATGPTLIKAPINPNGDSELALLMREMLEDAQRMKGQIEKGGQPAVIKKFETIHTATATEPEKATSAAFKAYADTYLNYLNGLQQAEDKEASTQLFKGLVESCMTCHQAMCPGPMVRIEKLYLED